MPHLPKAPLIHSLAGNTVRVGVIGGSVSWGHGASERWVSCSSLLVEIGASAETARSQACLFVHAGPAYVSTEVYALPD